MCSGATKGGDLLRILRKNPRAGIQEPIDFSHIVCRVPTDRTIAHRLIEDLALVCKLALHRFKQVGTLRGRLNADDNVMELTHRTSLPPCRQFL